MKPAQALLQKLREMGIGEQTRFVIVHPFGRLPRQWWPMDRLDELSRALQSDCDVTVVLVGGTEENPRTIAVPVAMRGRSLRTGYVFRQISKNGVNSRFEVLEPRGIFVLAMVRRMRGRPVFYVPE